MQAGKLDQRIILTAVASARDAFGDTTQTPDTANADTVWAEVREQSAAERQRNGITTTDKTYAIRMRYRPDYDNDTTFAITYSGRTLAVISNIAGGQNNREWLYIIASEAK